MMAVRGPGGQRKNSETKETSVLYVVAATPSSTTCHCRVLASSPCYCHSMAKALQFLCNATWLALLALCNRLRVAQAGDMVQAETFAQ